jgi:hypothetical protein
MIGPNKLCNNFGVLKPANWRLILALSDAADLTFSGMKQYSRKKDWVHTLFLKYISAGHNLVFHRNSKLLT